MDLPDIKPEGRFIVEENLRRMAKEAEKGVLAEVLDECETGERAQAWEKFFTPLWDQNIEAAEALFADEAGRAREKAKESPRVTKVPSELTPILHRYVFALLWADELATDGFRDPGC